MADAAAMVQAYKQGVANGGAKYAARVKATTKDVIGRAIQAVQSGRWLAAVSASQDRMIAGLQASSNQAWKDATAGIGAQRYAQSSQKAGDAYNKVAGQLAQAANNAQAAVAAQSAPLERVRAAANAMKQAFGHTNLI